MNEGARDTLVFDMKDFRHEDVKAYQAFVPAVTLGLTYEETTFTKPLACKVRIFRQVDDSLYVTTEVQTTLLVACRRCVKPIETDLATTVEILFSIGDVQATLDPDADADEERYYDGETLDISEDIRRALVLEIPTWPLCSETCEGLCPNCGTDLNSNDCSCEMTDDATAASNPFAVLAKMLEND